MLPLLWAAFYKYITTSTPLNKGERDQPPPDGTFERDHVNEVWAKGRQGQRVYEKAKNLPDEESTGQDV